MADPRFFDNQGPFTLSALAAQIGAELFGDDISIDDVAPLDVAGAGQLSFFDNVKYKEQFVATEAAAVICHPDVAEFAPKGCALLLSPAPYKSYAQAAQAFYPQVVQQGGVHESAVIGQGAVIGEGTLVEAGAVIGDNVIIGQGCRIGANAVISHAVIGDHVSIYRGAAIGQDGFGFAPDPAGFVKVPQLGRVIIGNGVEIGANTTIDRGAGPDTVIGDGTWIDNLVQIGHNVKIGRCCVIVAQVGISGSTVLDDFVMLGGQVGVAGHLHIGMGAKIGAQSGVMRNVPAGQEQLGSPAMPIKQAMRQIGALKSLIKNKKKA
ncbi:MAG: UDP-3-O-(3-hydroxymyristoyl)glucosamine N-acyltransferase [Alphaproteobacteria bacterium]